MITHDKLISMIPGQELSRVNLKMYRLTIQSIQLFNVC